MNLDSAGAPKRNRSKAKPAVASDPASTPKPRARKAKATAPAATPAVTVTSMTAVPTPSEAELLSMIEKAAYYLAEQRSFAPGHELDDWLAAERQIRALHT
jgi:hypothetical protein